MRVANLHHGVGKTFCKGCVSVSFKFHLEDEPMRWLADTCRGLREEFIEELDLRLRIRAPPTF